LIPPIKYICIKGASYTLSIIDQVYNLSIHLGSGRACVRSENVLIDKLSLFLIKFGQMEHLLMFITGDLLPGGEAPLVAGILMGLAGVRGGNL
jgi:hypothetical protein